MWTCIYFIIGLYQIAHAADEIHLYESRNFASKDPLIPGEPIEDFSSFLIKTIPHPENTRLTQLGALSYFMRRTFSLYGFSNETKDTIRIQYALAYLRSYELPEVRQELAIGFKKGWGPRCIGTQEILEWAMENKKDEVLNTALEKNILEIIIDKDNQLAFSTIMPIAVNMKNEEALRYLMEWSQENIKPTVKQINDSFGMTSFQGWEEGIFIFTQELSSLYIATRENHAIHAFKKAIENNQHQIISMLLPLISQDQKRMNIILGIILKYAVVKNQEIFVQKLLSIKTYTPSYQDLFQARDMTRNEGILSALIMARTPICCFSW